MYYNWNYFDKIYCISTTNSYLRRSYFNYLAKKLNINFCMKIFEKHSTDSNYGCATSHLHIFKEAYLKNYKKILIFEDDVIENYINPTILNKIINFLDNIEWDLFYFGAVPDCRKDNFCTKISNNFYKIKSLCTHAYAINQQAIKKYYNLIYYDIPIDYIFRDDSELKSYAHFPTQFFQETNFKVPQFVINSYFKILEFYSYYIGINIRHPIYRIIISLFIIFLTYKLIRNNIRRNNIRNNI